MDWADDLRQKLLAQFTGGMALFDAKVLSVDETAYTCEIEIDAIVIPEARLRAVVSDNQSIDVLPVEGSQVIVGKLGDDDFIVLACDKIARHKITVGNTVHDIDTTGHKISKGDESLRDILTDLVSIVSGIYAPKDMPGLTMLKNRINDLLK